MSPFGVASDFRAFLFIVLDNQLGAHLWKILILFFAEVINCLYFMDHGYKSYQEGKRPLQWKHKYLWKGIKEDIKNKRILYSCISGVKNMKMTFLSKAFYTCNVIPMEISTKFFTELEKANLKLIWNYQRPWRDR